MRLEHLSPPEVRPPFGRYHQAVAAVGVERLLFVSGQLGVRPDGSVPHELEAQTEQAFANIEALLVAGGFTRQQIVRLTVFLTEAEYRHGYMRVRDAWVADPPPASTLIIVKALALPACKVEIEAIAAA
jgi:enamine deaminase RidA (YjgF/YER057c/UK114 family)